MRSSALGPWLGVVFLSRLAAGCTVGGGSDPGDGGLVPPDGGRPDAPLTSDASARDVPATDAPGEPCNEVDDNGNGFVDEGCACTEGQTQPCFVGDPALAGVGACVRGSQACLFESEFGTWAVCTGSGAPTEEACRNGVDDDCDGLTDEGCSPGSCAPGDVPEPEICDNGVDEDCVTGRVVGRAVAYGAGRLLVWGDEHITFDSYGDPPREFWKRALAWLSCADCASPGTRVVTARSLPAAVVSDAATVGLTVSSGGFDPSADVLVLVGDTTVDPTALADWVWAGGGLMVMSVGLGDRRECDDVNAPLFELPLRFQCDSPAPWGPVDTLYPHPSTLGVTPESTPFVNGRWVIEDPGTGSTVLATVRP